MGTGSSVAGRAAPATASAGATSAAPVLAGEAAVATVEASGASGCSSGCHSGGFESGGAGDKGDEAVLIVQNSWYSGRKAMLERMLDYFTNFLKNFLDEIF